MFAPGISPPVGVEVVVKKPSEEQDNSEAQEEGKIEVKAKKLEEKPEEPESFDILTFDVDP